MAACSVLDIQTLLSKPSPILHPRGSYVIKDLLRYDTTKYLGEDKDQIMHLKIPKFDKTENIFIVDIFLEIGLPEVKDFTYPPYPGLFLINNIIERQSNILAQYRYLETMITLMSRMSKTKRESICVSSGGLEHKGGKVVVPLPYLFSHLRSIKNHRFLPTCFLENNYEICLTLNKISSLGKELAGMKYTSMELVIVPAILTKDYYDAFIKMFNNNEYSFECLDIISSLDFFNKDNQLLSFCGIFENLMIINLNNERKPLFTEGIEELEITISKRTKRIVKGFFKDIVEVGKDTEEVKYRISVNEIFYLNSLDHEYPCVCDEIFGLPLIYKFNTDDEYLGCLDTRDIVSMNYKVKGKSERLIMTGTRIIKVNLDNNGNLGVIK